MEIPVYIFTGFLEAGKTKFIQETLENKEFDTDENTLVIMCEEGIEELFPERFNVRKVSIVNIDDEDDINIEMLSELQKKYKAQRVVIEYNGMWQLDVLYKSLPKEWSVYQEIFSIDSSTIINYNQNMRGLVVDKLKSCEVVMFNRVTAATNCEELHKIVRGINRNANIAYEYTDGHVEEDEFEDPLPFNVNADVIEIADEDYAYWYRDMAEDPKKYVGRKLKFKGIVGRDKLLGDKAFIFGRHVMTCCEDDIAFQGLICKTKEECDLISREWAIITAKLVIGEHKVYGGEGPILIAQDIQLSEKPLVEVATF